MNPMVDLIRGLRGDNPTHCDWCGKETPEQALMPASGREWVCMPCLQKMDKEFERERKNSVD